MNCSPVPNIPPRGSILRIPPNDVLPPWEQLPPQRQRELIIALAVILVKRLPGKEHPEEGIDA
jgi:hypothetical protein